MGRWIGPGQGWTIALSAVLLFAAPAQASDPQAAERFRAAAALQARALFDLAAAEYAAIEHEFAADPLADRAALQRGICLFQLNQFAAAADELAPLTARDCALNPAEGEQLLAYYGLAEYNLSRAAPPAERDQFLDAAIDSLGQQLERFPAGQLAPRTAFYQAEALYARRRLDDAVAAYRRLLTAYPQHPQRADALFALGVAEQERGDFADAVETFTLFEKDFPQHADAPDARARHADALLSLTDSQLVSGKPLEARRTAERLLAEFPESALVPPALALKAQVELGQSELAAAEASLDECVRRSTHAGVTIDARLLRARVRDERGDFPGSLADARDVLAQDPNRTEALHLRGLCEARLGKPQAAAKTLALVAAAGTNYRAADRGSTISLGLTKRPMNREWRSPFMPSSSTGTRQARWLRNVLSASARRITRPAISPPQSSDSPRRSAPRPTRNSAKRRPINSPGASSS